MNYRVALLRKDGEIVSKNFDTKVQAEEYVLQIAEEYGIKVGWIKDFTTGKRDKIENL